MKKKYINWSRKAKFFPYAYNTQYQTRLGMSTYEVVFNQKPRKPLKIKLDQQPMRWDTAIQQKQVHEIHNKHILISRNSLVTQRLRNYRKQHLQKWFLDKEKHYNETYKTITKTQQYRKKLTDEMNLRFRTAKPLERNTFVLVTNQQQVDGVSKSYYH